MLNWIERLTLWNQYEIMKSLKPEEAADYSKNQEILAYGFEQFYPEINPSILTEATPRAVSQEVMDILGVFRAIKHSCLRIDYAPRSAGAEFAGFDANDEPDHYAVAHFLRRTEGRWDELADRPDNSHASTLDKYRAMLRTWRGLGGSHEMTAEQIEEVAEAR